MRPSELLRWSAALVLLLACVPGSALAAKTDVVILENGDRFTGEVKGVARGKLDYSTDDAGRLSIEWIKVAKLTSPNVFDIETLSGESFMGRLVAGPRGGTIVVEHARSDTLLIDAVVDIQPLNASVLQRIKSYLDLGVTVAKANQATTFSLGGAVNYRGPTLGGDLKFDSYAQGQEGDRTTKRNTVRQTVSMFLPDRWSAVAIGQFEQNDELNLEHRFTVGGGMNRVVKHTNFSEFSATAGVVGVQEEYTAATGNSSDSSVEAMIVADWDAFRFDSPKLDMSTGLAVFSSLFDFGRIRGQLQVRLKYEVFKDFHAGINFTDTFDSHPLVASASKNDYIATMTIGWSYRR